MQGRKIVKLFRFSSGRGIEQAATLCSSHSSSDESEVEEPLTTVPLVDLTAKTSSSSTSTSHTSSPLGSLLTLLPIPTKPKTTGSKTSSRPRLRKKRGSPLVSVCAVVTNLRGVV